MPVLFALIFVLSIAAFISPFFYGDKVNKYVNSRMGKIVSTEIYDYSTRNRVSVNREIKVKYTDKHDNLRLVSLYFIGIISYFGEDKIIKLSDHSPEFNEEQEKINKFEKKAIEFKDVEYKISGAKTLIIKQEYTNPNIGEFAFISDKPAPDDVYKIGLFTRIYVKNGKISDIR